MDNNIVCAKCAGRGYYFASESSTLRTPCSCQESPKKALINAMSVNAANLNHIASSGKINGTLMVETERILEEYASLQCAEMKEENERLQQWKKSMLEIWGPVIDWGQSKEAGLLPGTSISDEVLRRSRAYPALNKYNDLLIEEKQQLQEEVERLKSLMVMIRSEVKDGPYHHAVTLIDKALSGKESKTE